MLIQDHARSIAAENGPDRPLAPPANGPADREFVLAWLRAMAGALLAWSVVLVGAGMLLAG